MAAALWNHANWEEQPTPAGQLSSLKAWRTELRQALTLTASELGYSVDAGQIRQALRDSNDDLRRLEAQVAAANGTGRPIAVQTRTARRRGR